MRKIVLFAIAMLMCFTVTACNGGGDNGTATKIVVMNYGGGAGSTWIVNAAERFKARVADEEYESGKSGVSFDFTHTTATQVSLMKTAGFNMYFDEVSINIQSLASQGLLMDISDVVNEAVDTRDGKAVTVLDKIYPSERNQLKGADGKFYGLPHYEIYPGLSYDVEAFDRFGLYFADSGETRVTPFNCTLTGETVNFVSRNHADAVKNCGIDGVPGTDDDGLPTSIAELIALCDYMKKVHGIYPFTFTGWHNDYSNILIEALWINLAGYDQMRTNYTFDGSCDVVVGYEEENLFAGVNYIKKPKVATINVTMESGYEVSGMVAKYYALAFQEIAFKQDWFSTDCYSNTVSHVDAQGSFIWSGVGNRDKLGILIEGTHWYKESEDYGNFSDYFNYTGETERNLALLPIPITLDESVTGPSNSGENVILDVNSSYAVINGNIQNEGVIKACKDFLKFLYTDSELEQFTKDSGLFKAKIDYAITDDVVSSMSDFHKSVINMKKNNTVLYQTANNNKYSTFHINFSRPTVQPTFDGVGGAKYSSCFLAFKNNYTSRQIFEQLRMSAGQWV